MNKRVKTKSTLSRRRNGKKQRLSFQEDGKNLDNVTKDTADVSILSEEVCNSVFIGRNMRHATTDGSPVSMKSDDFPITIIMDIQWQPSWTVEMDAGAFRRIILNLFVRQLIPSKESMESWGYLGSTLS